MTRLLIVVAIFVFGLAIGVSLCKRKPPQAVEPDPFADKMMKRTGDLNKKLAEHKQARQDDKRTRRLSIGMPIQARNSDGSTPTLNNGLCRKLWDIYGKSETKDES